MADANSRNTERNGCLLARGSDFFFQDSLTSTELKPGVSTSTVANFAYGVNFARALGYHVFVTPLVDVNGPNTWAGSIHLKTYQEQQQWFDNYWQILKPYVTAAAQAGVEQLAIGTEEELLQNNAPDSLWNGLIANIRSVFLRNAYLRYELDAVANGASSMDA